MLSYRTEFEPPWTGASQVTLLSLTRLTRRDALSIVERVAGGLHVPDELVEHILTRSDGIPLFVEELTAAVLESGVVRRDGNRWILNGPLTQLAVPTTLQASLAARIDRLAPAKDVAQLAAAIGREFSYELVAAISPMTPTALQQAFDQLVTSGLVSRRGGGEQAIYLFKHALVRDAAYNTLLKGRRQQLHAAIATAMVERFKALSATQPEIVAHHYEEAGLIERAIEYWVAAGHQAVTRSANREAVMKSLGIDKAKDFNTYEYLGNIGTVSLPLTAAIAEEREFLQPGDKVGLLGIGSGLNCLMLGVNW